MTAILAPPGDWIRRPDLSCRKADPELFFADERASAPETEAARQICRRCPGYEDCRLYALTQPALHLWGIWGATTRSERLNWDAA